VKKKIFYSFLHGLLITILTWLYINSWFVFEIDEGLITKLLVLKDFLIESDRIPSSQVLLINTSKDIALARDPADYGNVTMTDRVKLMQFLERIDTLHLKPKFVLCDLLFDIRTPYDSCIQAVLDRMNNVVIPFLSADGRLAPPVFKAPTGIAQYQTNTGSFIKMRLITEDSLKSLSVLMDEMVNKKRYTRDGFFTYCNRRLSLNYITTNYYIRPFAYLKQNEYPLVNLGELTGPGIDDQTFRDFVANRYVIIGDFYGDVHETPIGKVPGPLILFNSFLSLQYEQHTISFGWTILLLVFFTLASYIAFYSRLPDWRIQKMGIFSMALNSLLSKYVSFLGLLLLLSLISLFVFGIHVHPLILSLYFSIINFISQNKRNDPTA
jgi:hypothetical protein